MKKYISFLLFIILIFIIMIFIFCFEKNKMYNNIKINYNSIKIFYPSTSYEKLNKKIRKNIDAQLLEFKNITLSDYKTNYYLIINYKEYKYKNIISYIFFSESYIGGAHPIHLLWTINYDTNMNDFITIENLTKKNKNILNDLSEYSYDFISKKKEFKRENILEMLKDGTRPLESNFKNILFSRDGLILYFERYQIAPYYYGDYNILIPYSDICLNI